MPEGRQIRVYVQTQFSKQGHHTALWNSSPRRIFASVLIECPVGDVQNKRELVHLVCCIVSWSLVVWDRRKDEARRRKATKHGGSFGPMRSLLPHQRHRQQAGRPFDCAQRSPTCNNISPSAFVRSFSNTLVDRVSPVQVSNPAKCVCFYLPRIEHAVD